MKQNKSLWGKLKRWYKIQQVKYYTKKYTKEDKKYDYQGIAINLLNQGFNEQCFLVGFLPSLREVSVDIIDDTVIVEVNGYEISAERTNEWYLNYMCPKSDSIFDTERGTAEYWDLHEDDMKERFNERYGK